MAIGLPLPVTGPRPGLLGRRSARSVPRSARVGRWALWGLFGVTVVLVAVPLIAPNGPLERVGDPFLRPGDGTLLGTDDQGRDLLSRVLYGMRTSWFAALLVIASGVLIGGVVGLVAGMAGGFVDSTLMRVTDLFLSLPGPLLVLVVVAALGRGLGNTLLAVMVVWWPFYARIVRGQVRAIMSRPHVEAARMGSIGRLRLAGRHVVPGTFGPLLVTASLDIGALLLTLASLSFLGLGSPPPSPELGAMTARGLTYLLTYWWVPVVPAVGVFLLALIGNLAGDALRDSVEG